MALLAGPPKPPSYPSGRYTRTNPLRHEFGLRLLTEPLPEPLRSDLIRAWRRPARFDGNEAIQSAGARAINGSDDGCSRRAGTGFPQAPAAEGVHRQRPDQTKLFGFQPRILSLLAFTELEASRRFHYAPLASISRETRNKLLAAQGIYLYALFAALSIQLGSDDDALAEFQRLLLKMR